MAAGADGAAALATATAATTATATARDRHRAGTDAPTPPPVPAGSTPVAAGPFATIEDVRAFEAALASVPGVRAVTVRGYEGDDRAIFDVEIGDS